jgi:uncharacterized membrane protein YphA (DoxX/SURF4 family)
MNFKRLSVTLLRFIVGWHFIYEGWSKIMADNWSAADFLAESHSFLSGFYHWLASPGIVQVTDILNMYGLLLIGLALFLGVLVRYSALAGFALLMLYYLAYPPFGVSGMMQPEGSVFIVNRQLIEAGIMLLFVFLKDTGYGLEMLRKKSVSNKRELKDTIRMPASKSRREVLKNLASLPLLGLLGWSAVLHNRKYETDTLTGATIKIGDSGLDKIQGTMPKGKIGPHEISRLVAGGNLIGGWAHSRDLIYVSSLFKAYNTEKKVFETLMLAEQAGINTINIGFPSNPLLQKYKTYTGSNIKVISQVAPNMESGDFYEQINQAISYGADIIQIQGNVCDWMVRDNRIVVIAKMMDRIREQGYTAGLASHTVDSLIACEEQGIIPDYYMKTMHHDKYWSAHPIENRMPFEVDGKNYLDHNRFHNNIFCLFPDRTVDFVERAKVPVMGFKVLAAGAIEPEDGFRWAFEKGADFICVGMFDFQIVNDVNIAINTLNHLDNRKRKWFG